MKKTNLELIHQSTHNNANSLNCPKCGEIIEIEKAYRSQIEKTLEAELEETKLQLTKELKKEFDEKAQAKSKEEILALKNKLAKNQEALLITQKKEAELIEKSNLITQKEKDLEIEVSKKVNEKLSCKLEESQKKSRDLHKEQIEILEKKYALKESSLRQKLDDAQQKLNQGSQQLQGESLEVLMEEKLKNLFPSDKFEEVKKGASGADLIQNIYSKQEVLAGTILWEFKNTKTFSNTWIEKLKKDKQNSKIEIAVIVSSSMPKDIKHFSEVNGIWVSSKDSFLSLAAVLRAQLLQVHSIRQANTGKDSKTEKIFEYLSGPHFKQRIEEIVDAFQTMQVDLQKEKTFILKNIAKREKQLENVLHGTAGMYGDLESLLGEDILKISGLEIEDEQDLLLD